MEACGLPRQGELLPASLRMMVRVHDSHMQAVLFCPDRWRASMDWVGCRWVLTGYSPQGARARQAVLSLTASVHWAFQLTAPLSLLPLCPLSHLLPAVSRFMTGLLATLSVWSCLRVLLLHLRLI